MKMLQDFNLQVSLHEGCKTILDKDSVAFISKQYCTQTKGYSLYDTDQCRVCQGNLIVNDSRDASKLIAFFCQHVYHDHCLQQETHMEPFCPICASRKSSKRKRD